MINRNSDFGRAVGRWGLIAAAIAALIAPAAAADLPVKAPPPAAPTWDGVYLGGSIGWEKTDTNWSTTCFTGNGSCTDGFFVDGSSPYNFSTSGARYGGYFGVNWQVLPAWVVGVEADAAWMNQSSRVDRPYRLRNVLRRFAGPSYRGRRQHFRRHELGRQHSGPGRLSRHARCACLWDCRFGSQREHRVHVLRCGH